MEKKVLVKRATYRDSITLLKLSDYLRKMAGVSEAAVVMATELNKKLLADVGLGGAEVRSATTQDMIIAIQAEDDVSLRRALSGADTLLSQAGAKTGGVKAPKSLEEALQIMPGANLAVISVPGQFAKREALAALAKGLNVFLFSSNVARKDEVELKTLAKQSRLLMMGPDCGTSIINRTVLGFGNLVREGPVGLVSASGTGIQEVTTLIHKAGLGISQAIGTGGSDLSKEVGGMMTLEAIELLETDPNTRTIVLISKKPPDERTARKVLTAMTESMKPCVVCFLGAELRIGQGIRGRSARTLEEAARIACELSGQRTVRQEAIAKEALETARSESSLLAEDQKYVRGLFAGGTLSYEAQTILGPMVGSVYSNSPIDPRQLVGGDERFNAHMCIDMGAEEFVAGRAHPMMDFTLRKRRILEEAEDPNAAVVLLDVELGYGSHPDPAGEIVPTIERAKAIAEKGGRFLPVVASVVGTDLDPQGLRRQELALKDAGVILGRSNAEAAGIAGLVASRGTIKASSKGVAG